jgi:CubicO group peptidase (beta-lactamase class C family)
MLALCSLLVGCSGGSGSGSDATGAPPAEPFAEVDRLANATFLQQGIPGMAVVVYDRNDRKVFEKVYGDFAPDRRVAVASASKMMAGLALFRLVDQGYLSLDSTTAAVLGWSGPQGAITLRHLLSFTSGLEPDAACTSMASLSLAECVDRIATSTPIAVPGTRFDYGSTHLHVAARMAEVVTGSTWNALFVQQVLHPLGLPEAVQFYSYPRQAIGTTNPLVAGGMRATMDEYGRMLAVVFHRGTASGQYFVSPALFDAQAREPYPDAVVGNSPMSALAYDFRYGLVAWLECATPATGCSSISSPGAFGWTPWVDREGGYYAIIGMEIADARDGVVNFSVRLAQDLKPAIRQALAAGGG